LGHWSRFVPLFFTSAALYLSFFLSVLAPVPLIWAHLFRGRRLAFLATLCNVTMVFLLAGWPGLAGYAVFAVSCAWASAEFARSEVFLRVPQAPSVILFRFLIKTSLVILVSGAIATGLWAMIARVSPWAELQRGLDWLGQQMLAQTPTGTLDAADWALQKEEWLRNFPSTLVIAVMIQAWVACSLLLRLNPSRIRDRMGIPFGFSRLWRNPEALVWPAIISGFGALILKGIPADFCWNLLKIFAALYAFQGLAILQSVLDLWGMRGPLRGLSVVFALLVMLPLVISLGFFDLWFDFRAKLRQS
jgi:hypothetical protein